MDAAKAGQSSSSGKIEKDCFDVIILSVPGGNELAIGLMSGLSEKRVACVSAGFFNADFEFFAHARDVSSTGHDRDAERFAEVGALLKLLVGFFPHAMVEMGGDDIVIEGTEEVQEGGGICSSGVANEDGLTGRDDLA